MGFSTVGGNPFAFKDGFELNSLFNRGDLKSPDGLRGELHHLDGKDGIQKYNIVARQPTPTDKIVYELTPCVDFGDTCRNIFRAMLTVLKFCIAQRISGAQKLDVEEQFEMLLANRQAETRFPFVDELLAVLVQLPTTTVEPGASQSAPSQLMRHTNCEDLLTIQKHARDFSRCRFPDKSVDVVMRMERAGYKGGLFGIADGGFTQPFLFKAEPDEETGKLVTDERSMLLDNGTVVFFGANAYTTPKQVLALKDPDINKWSAEDCAEFEHALAQELEARDLAEKLYGGRWTPQQVTMFAAALDEMVFLSQQFARTLLECPSKAPAEAQNPQGAAAECPEARLMRQYSTKLGTPPRFIPTTQTLSCDETVEAGLKRHRQLSGLGDDPAFRTHFASQVSHTRLTEGMTPDQIEEVLRTFANTSLTY